MSIRVPGPHASRRRLRTLLPCCALVTVAGVAQPVAAAASAAGSSTSGHDGHYTVRDLSALSGPTPFPHGCPGAAQDDTHIAGAEIEPAITVDPSRPGTIVATWQQDLGHGGRSDLIATSRDGGRTWSRRTIPGLTRCTGGTADSASDPWLSAGPTAPSTSPAQPSRSPRTHRSRRTSPAAPGTAGSTGPAPQRSPRPARAPSAWW